jgi:hypothetical protein
VSVSDWAAKRKQVSDQKQLEWPDVRLALSLQVRNRERARVIDQASKAANEAPVDVGETPARSDRRGPPQGEARAGAADLRRTPDSRASQSCRCKSDRSGIGNGAHRDSLPKPPLRSHRTAKSIGGRRYRVVVRAVPKQPCVRHLRGVQKRRSSAHTRNVRTAPGRHDGPGPFF